MNPVLPSLLPLLLHATAADAAAGPGRVNAAAEAAAEAASITPIAPISTVQHTLAVTPTPTALRPVPALPDRPEWWRASSPGAHVERPSWGAVLVWEALVGLGELGSGQTVERELRGGFRSVTWTCYDASQAHRDGTSGAGCPWTDRLRR